MKSLPYIFETFEVYGFYTSKFLSADQNTVSRFRAMMHKAIQEQILLPKYVIIIPDDDLVSYFGCEGAGFNKNMNRLLNHIMSEHNKLILAQKDYLPNKAKRPLYPHIVWLQSPYHRYFRNNNLREEFNRCLIDVVRFHDNTITLPFKKIWDEEDSTLRK